MMGIFWVEVCDRLDFQNVYPNLSELIFNWRFISWNKVVKDFFNCNE